MSAVAVASASAAAPNFEGAAFPVGFTAESLLPLEPLLEGVIQNAKLNILCQMATSKGEVRTATTVGKIEVLYVGCKVDGGTQICTTAGQAPGMITTKLINGTTGFLTANLTVAGLLLKPEVGTVFAEFTCALPIGKVTVEGSVIGEALPFKLGQLSTMGELIFEPNATLTGPKWSHFEDPEGPLCELTIKQTQAGKAWLMDHELITFAQALELK